MIEHQYCDRQQETHCTHCSGSVLLARMKACQEQVCRVLGGAHTNYYACLCLFTIIIQYNNT